MNPNSSIAELTPQQVEIMPELHGHPRPLELAADGRQEMDGMAQIIELHSDTQHAEMQVPHAELWARHTSE